MARQTSKGVCIFCHAEYSKSGMTRHLETCQQRSSTQAQSGRQQKAQKTRKFHLLVEGRDSPQYWMHLDVASNITLVTLDQFLRAIWLECCGHLSAFEIGGVTYSVDTGMINGWDSGDKSMRVRVDKVFSPGQTCSYEYDFGTTTELTLKVISEREAETKGKPIQILARNNPPAIACDVCGKPATNICSECVYDNAGWLCDECAEGHSCGEDMLLPVTNSPRVGMCAYTGPDPAYAQ
jgi:Plasmid pRiA4b ORF-3-like protein